MPSKDVIVIGGGLAGLSCATALTEAGLRVRLLEKRPYLGGRATSYLLPGGDRVDNCQHVMLGCCTNLDDFYRRVGAADKIRTYDRLIFADPAGRRGVIEASPLPAPFHLGPSFMLFPSLSWADKGAIGRAMLAIVGNGGLPPDATGSDITMLEWLRRHRQTDSAIARFWSVVLTSALDEELARTSARYGIDVFWKAFLANRAGFHLGIPAVALGELYEGCRARIEKQGGEVRTRTDVRRIQIVDGCARGVEVDDGSEFQADFCVAAVPHNLIVDLLPPEVVEREPIFTNLSNLGTSPITGVHLWFDRTVMTEPFLILLDLKTQWIFNKTRLLEAGPVSSDGRPSPRSESEQYLQVVISASYDLVRRPRQEIIKLCLAELRSVLPGSGGANLIKAVVVKETAATFSPAPGCDRWRPSQVSPVRNLFLAGDWTATGWPATMESAVRSGYLAAEAILAETGRPMKLLQPELEPEGLARRAVR